jgi:hypothetical protein
MNLPERIPKEQTEYAGCPRPGVDSGSPLVTMTVRGNLSLRWLFDQNVRAIVQRAPFAIAQQIVDGECLMLFSAYRRNPR